MRHGQRERQGERPHRLQAAVLAVFLHKHVLLRGGQQAESLPRRAAGPPDPIEAVNQAAAGVDPLGGRPDTVRRRCSDGNHPFVLRAGVPAPDDGSGTAAGAWALCCGTLVGPRARSRRLRSVVRDHMVAAAGIEIAAARWVNACVTEIETETGPDGESPGSPVPCTSKVSNRSRLQARGRRDEPTVPRHASFDSRLAERTRCAKFGGRPGMFLLVPRAWSPSAPAPGADFAASPCRGADLSLAILIAISTLRVPRMVIFVDNRTHAPAPTSGCAQHGRYNETGEGLR